MSDLTGVTPRLSRWTLDWIGSKPLRACVPMTPLGQGALFFLVEPDAEIGVTIANRAMTHEERDMYSASPASRRRRKPGSSVESDDARKQALRTKRLVEEAMAMQRRAAGDVDA